MKKLPNVLVTLTLLAIASAAQADQTARYVGTDGDWFNPRNWSTGRVPDRNTDVVIGGNARVVVDPTRWRRPVEIRDLSLQGNARLETLPGTIFLTRNEEISGHSELIHRSTVGGTHSRGGSLIVTSYQGWGLNPSTKSHRDVILKTSVTSSFGLGGDAPASPLGVGRGHYATLVADHVVLGGRLVVQPMYGFRPQAGQTFQIVTANRWAVGQFRGLPEGALAARIGDVGLFITYQGGDGNDVVLIARDMSVAP